MQKPIRYYITKSGDEPTVRSVTIALGSPRLDDRAEDGAVVQAEPANPARESDAATDGVKRRVKNAIRRRAPRS
jgi:hypothetical protein